MGQTTCSIESCDKPARGRGWCAMHYWRWQKYGDPDVAKPQGGQPGRRRPTDPDGFKTCCTCRELKPMDAYNLLAKSADGRQPRCRDCQKVAHGEWYERRGDHSRAMARKWNRENPEAAREHHFKCRYGITFAQYEEMRERQGSVCAICRQPCGTGKNLSVDHCHTTGKVRGLLCDRCNRGLGSFDDDMGRMRAAVDYLARMASMGPRTRRRRRAPTQMDLFDACG